MMQCLTRFFYLFTFRKFSFQYIPVAEYIGKTVTISVLWLCERREFDCYCNQHLFLFISAENYSLNTIFLVDHRRNRHEIIRSRPTHNVVSNNSPYQANLAGRRHRYVIKCA